MGYVAEPNSLARAPIQLPPCVAVIPAPWGPVWFPSTFTHRSEINVQTTSALIVNVREPPSAARVSQ